jgi:hypothetical protein
VRLLHKVWFGLSEYLRFDVWNIDSEMSLYPDLEAQKNAVFVGVLELLLPFMPDVAEKDSRIKAVNIWASVNGLIALLRRGNSQNS